MPVVDFSRSFVTFRIDVRRGPLPTVSHAPSFTVNDARVLVECCCEVLEHDTGRVERFVLGASCKTERVAVARELWISPNADFVPVFSDRAFLLLKTYDHLGRAVSRYPPELGPQPDRQTGATAETFDHVRIDLERVAATRLSTRAEIVAATLANNRLVARTRIEKEGRAAVLEYPVKTMNVSDHDGHFQVDTGPLVYPDLSRPWEDLLAGVELAFVAFNAFDWAEFLVRIPTSIGAGIEVQHYSRAEPMPALNEVFRLDS